MAWVPTLTRSQGFSTGTVWLVLRGRKQTKKLKTKQQGASLHDCASSSHHDIKCWIKIISACYPLHNQREQLLTVSFTALTSTLDICCHVALLAFAFLKRTNPILSASPHTLCFLVPYFLTFPWIFSTLSSSAGKGGTLANCMQYHKWSQERKITVGSASRMMLLFL